MLKVHQEWRCGTEGKKERKHKETFILGLGLPETSYLVGYLEYFACTRKLPSMSWLESTMQRLRSSGSSIWGNLVSTPRLKRKASNTWAAVQDAFFSTKVCVCVFYFIYFFLSGFYFESELMGINYFLWILFDCDFLVFVSVF